MGLDATVVTRFWSKVHTTDQPGECWEWRGSRLPRGYGMFGLNRRVWRAHRVAWLLTHGPIGVGVHICHHCDNPACCNPSHLYAGNASTNNRDAWQRGRRVYKPRPRRATTCGHGPHRAKGLCQSCYNRAYWASC